MQLILIRHGQPDYNVLEGKHWKGFGRDMAPLTEKGIRQAEEAAAHTLLEGCELLLTSPFTRTMHTAAIISGKTGIPMQVEVDLHEWMPDRDQEYASGEEAARLYDEFYAWKGVHPPGRIMPWESITEMDARILPVIERYRKAGYRKIAAAVHGEVMRRFLGRENIAYCEVCRVVYDDSFQPFQWK